MEGSEFEDEDLITAMESIESLSQMFPGRHQQIQMLYNMLGTSGDVLPSCIYVYGDTATGKTQVVRGVASMASAHTAFVNCVECYTTRLLLEPILDGLLDGEFSKQSGGDRCDSMMELVRQLRIADHNNRLDDAPCIIVLDNCERLFDLGEHYFPAFQKLQELTCLSNLCVVFISQILPEKYSVDVPYIKIFFPQYNKDEVLKILMRDAPENEEEEALFKQFIAFFLDTFYLATRDLNELKHQMVALYPQYVAPVQAGKVRASDTHALYKHINPHIRSCLTSVYLPGIAATDENNLKSDKLISTKVQQSLDLPYYAKYFLIAAFLASYNSPKEDKRLFVKNHGKKKKRLVQDQKKENASKELLGPKQFTLDRLLAIFYAIMEEKTPLNANLLAQISTLVELRLLVRFGDDLDKPKYKCAVGISCVEAVSRTLDFNVRKYMVH